MEQGVMDGRNVENNVSDGVRDAVIQNIAATITGMVQKQGELERKLDERFQALLRSNEQTRAQFSTLRDEVCEYVVQRDEAMEKKMLDVIEKRFDEKQMQEEGKMKKLIQAALEERDTGAAGLLNQLLESSHDEQGVLRSEVSEVNTTTATPSLLTNNAMKKTVVPTEVDRIWAKQDGVRIGSWFGQEQGVFATGRLAKRKRLGRLVLRPLSETSVTEYTVKGVNEETLDGRGDGWVKFVNHSCNPNARLMIEEQEGQQVISLQTIRPTNGWPMTSALSWRG